MTIRFGSDPKIMRMIHQYGGDILSSESFRREQKYMQHGTTSTYTHSLAVCYMALMIAGRMPDEKLNLQSLVRGCLLHDYFLYDWHERDASHRLHGFTHARRAMENAIRDFSVSPLEARMIRSHMFPLNLTRIPTSREAWILCLADKICASCETLHMAGYSEELVSGGEDRTRPVLT